MRLTPKREAEIRRDDLKYLTRLNLAQDRKELLDEVDALRSDLTAVQEQLRVEKQDRDNMQAALVEACNEAQVSKDMYHAVKHTVVATIGGTDDEGNPTSEINYLQRLRALVSAEQKLARAVEEFTQFHGQIHGSPYGGCRCAIFDVLAELTQEKP